MLIFEYFFSKYLKYSLLNKFNYCKSLKNTVKLEKIKLNFKSKFSNLKLIAKQLLLIELITNKKGTFIVSKKQNVVLKIKAGNPIGCKIILSKKIMFKFLKKFVFGSLYLKKNEFLNCTVNKNIFIFNLKRNVVLLFNLKKFYTIFNDIKNLNLILIFKNKFN